MISGVKIKELMTFADDRGYFRELWRADQEMGAVAQTSITMSLPGVIKAFHYHKLQTDVWYVASGQARVVLHDLRDDSPTKGATQQIVCGTHKPVLIFIPTMVCHGYQVLGTEPVVLVYHTSLVYKKEDPDEYRIQYNDPTIGFDWSVKNR